MRSLDSWPQLPPSGECGVIVAADITQQWLLPWWWDNYQKSNNYPVTFVNLGMTSEVKQWCQERGSLIDLPFPSLFTVEKEAIPAERVESWESVLGETMWHSRDAWFKKPLACLQSPYLYTLWIDLDCQILQSLLPLFTACKASQGLAMTKQGYQNQYNAGVIAFHRGLPLLETWAKRCLTDHHLFPGDEDVLCHLIHEEQFPITDLPSHYNLSRHHKETAETVILHWHGPHGKQCIEHQLMRLSTDLL